jgi:hypothetical protein
MITEPENTFVGPLFVVGMPRSGTKVLREMLEQHPSIRFSHIETDFLPYWVFNWSDLMPTESPEQFARFYSACLQLPFFVQNSENGVQVSCEGWLRNCADFTPAAVFEGLMRTVIGIRPADKATIWADKSPSYVRHIPLLLEQFPQARIVHIIRDARDHALSMRQAWRKSVLRAAQRWQDDVSKARGDGRAHPDSYIEVRYEDLLDNPARTLKMITVFLGIPYADEMINPQRVVENMGAARHTSGLLRDNSGKYRSLMSPRLVARIEELAGPTLRELGYECAYQGQPLPLPRWRMKLLQIIDGWNLVHEGIARFGLMKSIRFYLTYFKISGNRR